MEDVVKKLTNIVKTKNIKVVTISEPNHRSYTSHTFNFELMKSILKNTNINTFSTEKLGVFDAMMINWYLRKGKKIPEQSFDSKGLGTKRWLEYFKRLRSDRYNLVGGEFNHYNPMGYDTEPLKDLFSKTFIESFLDPYDGGGDIQVETENDKLARDSFECIEDFYKNRESFWKLNIERILKKYDNLFIVGFHLSKHDPIGKMIKKLYPDSSLFIGSCALNISTQILIVPDKFSETKAFNKALETRHYTEKVEKIDPWAPPTPFEKTRKGAWDLTKVVDSNKDKKIRGIGCFIGMNQKDYLKKKKVPGVLSSLKEYDYIVFMKDSQYQENMYL